MDAPSPYIAAALQTEESSQELLVSHDGAPAATGGFSGTLMQMAPLFAVFAIIYFLILRPQQQEQKKLQALLSGLKKGDSVITSSGMHGSIHEVRGDELIIEVADRVRITFDRSAVQRIAGAASDEKTKEG
jgi:preprotein translocase subunit YajC